MSTTAHQPGSPARHLVRRHPLVAFFTLALGISWLLWLPYVLSGDGLGVLDLTFPSLLGTTQFAGILPGAYAGPLTAALIVTATAEGRPGLRRWGRRLVRFRVGWRWYVAVLVGVPASLLLATFLLPGAVPGAVVPGLVVLVAYVPQLAIQVFTSGLAEEPGWRDFALPRLQHRYGAVPGTLVLGVLWGTWHLPLFLTASWGGWPDLAWSKPVEFVVGCVAVSIVMTWVFNRTGRGLPLMILFHASINTTMGTAWVATFPTLDARTYPAHVLVVTWAVLSAIVLVATRGRLGLAPADGGAAGAPADTPAAPGRTPTVSA